MIMTVCSFLRFIRKILTLKDGFLFGTSGLGRAGHADELAYLLFFSTKPDIHDDTVNYSKETVLTRYRLLKLWTNFIKYT